MSHVKKLIRSVIVTMLICTTVFQIPNRARADLFGGDVMVLTQILIQAIDQVYKLQQLVSKTAETVRILDEMNRGVKEVLRLAETAHIPIPPQVLERAKQIDQAVWEAKRVYGEMGSKSPIFARTQYQTGIEGLHLSADAFDYSTFLDRTGERVKASAVVANQSSATKLTAETMGVLLHSMSHSNRIEAKLLEQSSTQKLEDAAKEGARFDSFVNTHGHIEETLKRSSFSSLNGVGY